MCEIVLGKNPEGQFRPARTGRLGAIETEILQEKAQALGRAGERLEKVLEALDEVRDAIERIERSLQHSSDIAGDTAPLRSVHRSLTTHLKILRDRARLVYHQLIIQREAVGVRNHLDVERCYRMSERWR